MNIERAVLLRKLLLEATVNLKEESAKNVVSFQCED